MTEDREVYSWGSNERGQLGVSKRSTEKTIEFSSYSYEDPNQDDVKARTKEQERGAATMNDQGSKNDSTFVGEDMEEEGTSKPAVNFASAFEHKGLVPQIKTVKKHYSGIPKKLSSIQGKIENIACGDWNSFAIVKI